MKTTEGDEMTECPKCGGWGGEPGSNFGDYGWHPCFFCSETGVVSTEDVERDKKTQDELAKRYERWYKCYEE